MQWTNSRKAKGIKSLIDWLDEKIEVGFFSIHTALPQTVLISLCSCFTIALLFGNNMQWMSGRKCNLPMVLWPGESLSCSSCFLPLRREDVGRILEDRMIEWWGNSLSTVRRLTMCVWCLPLLHHASGSRTLQLQGQKKEERKRKIKLSNSIQLRCPPSSVEMRVGPAWIAQTTLTIPSPSATITSVLALPAHSGGSQRGYCSSHRLHHSTRCCVFSTISSDSRWQVLG